MEDRMYFNHPVQQLIKNRKSCRTFDKKSIEGPKLDEFGKFIKLCSNETFRFDIIEKSVGPEGQKLGTYGVIRNARVFVVAIAKTKTADMCELGAIFETIVLYGADRGFSSCWLGGTFDRAGFSEMLNISNEEYIPIVIPFGYAAQSKSIIERLMRKLVGSENRRSWNELFFKFSQETPLTPEDAEEYRLPLEMLRLAPSAKNIQPWRVIRDGLGFHFYLSRSKGFEKYGYDIQLIDIGIALSHFALAAKDNHIRGRIVYSDPGIKTDLEYVRSWVK
jgi:nitroreductase